MRTALWPELADTVPGVIKPSTTFLGTAVGIRSLRFGAGRDRDEAVQWKIDLSGYTGGNIQVHVHFFYGETSVGAALLGGSLCAQKPTTQNINSTTDAWAVESTVQVTHPGGQVRRPQVATIIITDVDGAVAGDVVLLRLRRLSSNVAQDTMAGGLHVERAVIEYPSA